MKIPKEEYEGGFVKAEDVRKGMNQLTIAGSDLANTDYGQKRQLKFAETPKLLSLNKTSTQALVEMYGDESDEWVGKPISLEAVKVQVKGELKDAVFIEKQNISGAEQGQEDEQEEEESNE